MSQLLSRRPEILAPAGSAESLAAAVRCGADAVYVGGHRFSARANAANFSDSELEKAVNYCHLCGVKLYRAMNTLVLPEETEDFLAAAKRTAEMGADGLIIQDIGAAKLLAEMLPDMKLNASTQMTVHTPEGAKLAAEIGFSRIVAARELSLSQIKDIADTGIETEVFIHGALCMSVSGQCYMSAMIGSRSANRGMCAQACRLPINAIGNGQERYDLSLKDLCGIPRIKALAEAGAASLKIEGRMKRPEYVAAAVTAVRAALDGEEPDLETLRAVFSRSGFTDGYITGRLGEGMFGFRRKDDVVAAEAVLPELKEGYRKEVKPAGAKADFEVSIKSGEPARLSMTCGDITVTAEGTVPEKALKRPADMEYVSKQLEKLGDTIYTIGNISGEIDGGLMISASAVNTLRRETVQKMDCARIAAAKPKQRYNEVNTEYAYESRRPEKIRVSVSDKEQLKAAESLADETVIPLDMCGEVSAKDNYIVSLPRFVTDEEKLKKRLAEIKAAGFERLLCTNLAHIKIGRDMGFTLSGGFGLNIANPFAAKAAAEMGLSDITASFEAKLTQITKLCGGIPVGVIVYGRLPLMLTRNCPVRQAVGGCKNCSGGLTDRTGRFFPVRCTKEKYAEYSEVLNCDPLMMTDRVAEVRADFIELDFSDESAEEARRIIACAKSGRKALDNGYTRGLYYRGIN